MADSLYRGWTVLEICRDIKQQLNRIEQGENTMAGELDNLTAQVTQTTNVEQSAIKLLTNLHDLLVNAGTDPAKLTALANTLSTEKDTLAAAIIANTPAG